MTNFVKYFKLPAITITSIILASCGGGDDGDDPITNSAPAFPSSSDSVNFAENSTDVVYTASATDAEGNTITYALSGGDDQDQFSIGTSSGELLFKSPPDHENPSDDGGNNVYEVEISASDSSASSKMTLEVTVTNVVEDGEDGGGGDGTNQAPTAIITVTPDPDSTTLTTATEITLNGSSSTDPNNDELAYAWSQSSDQDISLTSLNTAITTFTAADAGTYTFTLTVSDAEFSNSAKVELTINSKTTSDTTAPSEPQLISLASADASSMDVDWFGSSDDQTGSALIEYQIHAATTSGFTPDSSTLQSSVSNTISATITGLEANTEYFVVVLAVDEAGNQSTSEEKSVTTASVDATATDEAVAVDASAVTTVDDDTITLDKSAVDDDLSAGDVVISDQDEGLLLLVDSVNDTGSELEVSTSQASLVDAFDEVEFNLLTTLEDVDSNLETQGMLVTGQSASGLAAQPSSQSELRWPSGLRLRRNELSANQGSASFQPMLHSSDVQSIDSMDSATLAVPYEVYASPNDSIISFDVLLEVIEEGVSFDDLEVTVNHDRLDTPDDVQVQAKSSIGGRYEYYIQWTNDRETSSTPYTVEVSARESGCWFFCTLRVMSEVYVTSGDKDALFEDTYTISVTEGAATMTAETSVGFSPDFDIAVVVEGSQIKRALTQIRGDLDMESMLSFVASSSEEFTYSPANDLYSKEFTKVVMAGFVPVVITGKLKLVGEISANISGAVDLSTTIENSVRISAGIEYIDGAYSYKDSADTTYKFEVIGEAGASVYGELRLIPEIEFTFYRVVGADMTLEPYVFAETELEGVFSAIVDDQFEDVDANYRFTELEAGVALDASLTAKFGLILDDKTLGIEETWNNDEEPILGPAYLVSLPSAAISTLSAASPANGLLLGLATTDGKLGITGTNEIQNGYWQVYPEDSSTNFSASGSNILFDYSTDYKYELRYVYYSELGSFVRQYQSLEVDLEDSDGDGLNNQYENYYSFLDPYDASDASADHDNDGYDNLSEYLGGSYPDSSESVPSDSVPPATPANFQAEVGDTTLKLTWTPSAFASTYYIYMATSSGVTPLNYNDLGGQRFETEDSELLLEGLENDTTYYLVIVAQNASGSSSPSAEISATPEVAKPEKELYLTFNTALIGSEAAVSDIEFSDDSRTLLSGESNSDDSCGLSNYGNTVYDPCDDNGNHFIRYWSLSSSNQQLSSIHWHDYYYKVASDGDVESDYRLGNVNAVALAPDGSSYAAIGEYDDYSSSYGTDDKGRYITIWDATTGDLLKQIFEADKTTDIGNGYALAYTSDSKTLIAGYESGDVVLWDIASGTKLTDESQHGDRVTAIHLHPVDGNSFVTSSYDQSVKIWDAASGKVTRTLFGHSDRVTDAKFSPDGTLIASVGYDETINIWSASTGELIQTITGGSSQDFIAVAFADNDHLVTGSDWRSTDAGKGGIDLWYIPTGVHLQNYTGHTEQINALANSPDGSYIASASADETIRLWSIGSATSAPTATPELSNSLAEDDQIDLLWSAVNSASYYKLFDNDSGELLYEGNDLSFSHENLDSANLTTYSYTLAACNLYGCGPSSLPYTVLLTNVPSAASLSQNTLLIGSEAGVSDIEFSADSRTLLSGESNSDDSCGLSNYGNTVYDPCDDNGNHFIRYWSLSSSSQQLSSIHWHDYYYKVASDGDVESDYRLGNVDAVALAPDGSSYAAIGEYDDYSSSYGTDGKGRYITIWDATTGDRLGQIFEADKTTDIGNGYALAYTSDSKNLIAGYESGDIVLWDIASGTKLTDESQHGDRVTAIHVHPVDGNSFVTSSYDQSVKIWDSASGKVTRTLFGHSSWVTDAKFSPDGSLIASVGRDGVVNVWSTATGELLHTMTRGYSTQYLTAVAFADDDHLVTGSEWYSTEAGFGGIDLWHIPTGVHLQNYTGHTGQINALANSPNGSYIASASADESIRVWNFHR